MRHVLHTGQTRCWDASGREIPCRGTGQDGEWQRGAPWPAERFVVRGEVVTDGLTGLHWCRDATVSTFPCTWAEAFALIDGLNRERHGGRDDWRLPNRNELRSLMSYQARKPALAEGHPFVNVFLGWYWTSTTAAISPAYAWAVHLEGARMFYGRKDQPCLAWPVSGTGNQALARTGQTMAKIKRIVPHRKKGLPSLIVLRSKKQHFFYAINPYFLNQTLCAASTGYQT